MPSRSPAPIQLAELPHHVDRRLHRVLGMIGSSSGAPNSAITMSPTNLSTVPLCRKTISTIREKYSFSWATSRFRVALLGDRGEAADVGEQHRHVAALAPELGQLGVRDELVVDVLRHVSAEQSLHFPLLAILDEILIGGAGKQRDGAGRERLDHVQPRSAPERAQRRTSSSRRESPSAAPAAAPNGRKAESSPTADRHDQDDRDPRSARRGA